jgi:hypothetical protein
VQAATKSRRETQGAAVQGEAGVLDLTGPDTGTGTRTLASCEPFPLISRIEESRPRAPVNHSLLFYFGHVQRLSGSRNDSPTRLIDVLITNIVFYCGRALAEPCYAHPIIIPLFVLPSSAAPPVRVTSSYREAEGPSSLIGLHFLPA